MSTGETYVTAAYLVVLAVVFFYVVIYSFKLKRLEQDVAKLRRPRPAGGESGASAEEGALAGSPR